MAIPLNTVRVTLKWTPNATDWPNELAINTLHFRVTELEPPSPNSWSTKLTEIATKVRSVLVADWSPVAGFHASGYEISQIKAAQLDATGKTLEEAAVDVVAGALAGSGSSGVLPPEVAICVSLYGYQPGSFTPQRGRKRGRIYLPYISQTKTNDAGQLSSGDCDALCGGWKTIITDLSAQTLVSSTIDPVIASEAGDMLTTVTWVAVDNHFDSQRRRQHQSAPILVKQQVASV